MMETRYKRRFLSNWLFTLFCLLSTGIGLSLLLVILTEIVSEGLQALSLNVFLLTTPAPGENGGLINAIVGSLMITGLSMLAAIPIGVMAGIYLSEYNRNGKLTHILRFINDILLSAPSICFGLFAYQIIVKPFHSFSGYAGAFALAIIAIPLILSTTADMLYLVPNQLREASAALGASTSKIVFTICLRAARSGILTGILLAFARIIGETAPLMFTALNNQFWNIHMTGPTANLSVTIYQLALSPYHDWHRLAWAGAMLITLFVLIIDIMTRIIMNGKKQKGS